MWDIFYRNQTDLYTDNQLACLSFSWTRTVLSALSLSLASMDNFSMALMVPGDLINPCSNGVYLLLAKVTLRILQLD